MTAQQNPDVWAQLRAPFPPDQVHKLPRATRRDNQKGKCNECGGWHGLPAVHLDYVGHAEVTDRLLKVDPTWTWEPVAFDERGLPAFVYNGSAPVGLWIRLTICGVTRIGYGSVEPGVFDAEKQLIGDAIRNAAMRFGVALDLWAKSDLHTETFHDEPPARPAPPPAERRQRLADTARELGATPVESPAPATKRGEPNHYLAVTHLMASERVTSADLRAVLGDFSRAAVNDWIEAEPGRTPESLILAAQRKRQGGADADYA